MLGVEILVSVWWGFPSDSGQEVLHLTLEAVAAAIHHGPILFTLVDLTALLSEVVDYRHNHHSGWNHRRHYEPEQLRSILWGC